MPSNAAGNSTILRVVAALFLLAPVAPAASAQQDKPGAPAEVQPGAPGQSVRVLPPATAPIPPNEPTAADIAFMRGMIMHHGQAVEMTALMPTRTRNRDLLELGKRISISQTDEMAFMKRWLTDRGIPVAEPSTMAGMDHAHMDHMNMDHMDMAAMPSMPGMLTPRQMDALRKATGPRFDHLFLTGMIQHHTGALTMVQQLFDTPAAGQDALLFDFTSDVNNTQQAEIDIMRHMLAGTDPSSARLTRATPAGAGPSSPAPTAPLPTKEKP